MIANLYRFHGHGSLRFAYRNGKSIRGQYFSLKYVSNSRRSVYRASVVVSKKVSKLAVVRNQIRRRIYEIVRTNQDSINGPYDLVFIVYSDQLLNLDHEQLKKIVIQQLTQAGVILYKEQNV